jgi:hypothetical protein
MFVRIPSMFAKIAILSIVRVKDEIEEISLLTADHGEILTLTSWTIVSEEVLLNPDNGLLDNNGGGLRGTPKSIAMSIKGHLADIPVDNVFSTSDWDTAHYFLGNAIKFYTQIYLGPSHVRRHSFPYIFSLECIRGLNRCKTIFRLCCSKFLHGNDIEFDNTKERWSSYVAADKPMLVCAAAQAIEVMSIFYDIGSHLEFERRNGWSEKG